MKESEPGFTELVERLLTAEGADERVWSEQLMVKNQEGDFLVGLPMSEDELGVLDQRHLDDLHERIPTYIGAYLKLLRISRDVSMTSVAHACSCSQPTVSRIEQGYRKMRADHLAGYAKALNMSFIDLVDALDEAVLGLAYHG